MNARKVIIMSLVSVCLLSAFEVPFVQAGTAYVIQGIYQLSCPTGERSWSVTLSTGEEYFIYLGLYTPGSAHFTLTVVDPWLQDYTFVDLEFWHGDASDDLYRGTFTPPVAGQYSFMLKITDGPGQALQVYFAISDMGEISNTHTSSTTPLTDAHACNLSHVVWTYFVALEGSATYFIDVARGDPNGTYTAITVKAKIQAQGGLEIPVLGNIVLPWDEPECNESQAIKWAGEWFGVPATATYNVIVEVSGLISLDPVVVALTICKEEAHGSSGTGDTEPEEEGSVTEGLVPGLDTLALSVGPVVVALGGALFILVLASKTRKGNVQAKGGEVRRSPPAFEEE